MSSRLPTSLLCGGGKDLPCSVRALQATRGRYRSCVAGETEVYPPSHLIASHPSELMRGPGMGRRQGSGSDRLELGGSAVHIFGSWRRHKVLHRYSVLPTTRDLVLTCTGLRHPLTNDVQVSGYRYFYRYLRLSISPLNAIQHQTTAIFNSLTFLFFLHFPLSPWQIPQSLLLLLLLPSLHDVVE